jgi:hypothetical protein
VYESRLFDRHVEAGAYYWTLGSLNVYPVALIRSKADGAAAKHLPCVGPAGNQGAGDHVQGFITGWGGIRLVWLGQQDPDNEAPAGAGARLRIDYVPTTPLDSRIRFVEFVLLPTAGDVLILGNVGLAGLRFIFDGLGTARQKWLQDILWDADFARVAVGGRLLTNVGPPGLIKNDPALASVTAIGVSLVEHQRELAVRLVCAAGLSKWGRTASLPTSRRRPRSRRASCSWGSRTPSEKNCLHQP